MTDDLQSWSEVPRIAHFCSLFRKAFNLLEFDIQDLEEGLLLLEDEERLVPQLVVRLLKGCSRTFTKVVNEENYNKYLRRLFISKAEEAEEDEVEYDFECEDFTENSLDFEDLPLRDRVRLLHQLCEFRLDGEDVSDKVKNLEASSLRVEPLGKDSEGYTYWYFYGTRLYKEASPTSSAASTALASSEDRKRRKEKDKKKRKKKEKKKKKKKNSHSSSEDETPPESSVPSWSVACLTLQDWIDLTDKVRHSKKKLDKELYLTLSDNFLPEIIKMFADKEREERRRLLLMAPKRYSSRIERKRADQEEKDRLLAEKLEEEDEGQIFGESSRLSRQRGRSRKSDDLVVEKNRSERLRQREQMKELREKKNAEKEVARAFPSEVEIQRRNLGRKKSSYSVISPSKVSDDTEEDDDLTEEDGGSSPSREKKSQLSKKITDDEEDEEEIEESKKERSRSRNSKGGGDRSSKKASRKSGSPSKKESRSRKRRNRTHSSSSSSKPKKHKWKSESSSSSDNEEDEDPNDKSYSEASEEEIHQSESSNGEEITQNLVKEVDNQEEEARPESPKAPRTSTFANALLKVGTKSTRDSTLDKSIRKSPGRLLQTAGLQKSGNLSSSKIINGDRLNGGGLLLSNSGADKNPLEGNADEDLDEDEEPKISFSLYGGHLPVDIGGSFPKSVGDCSGSPGENRLLGLSSSTSVGGTTNSKKDEPESPVRKVFSNWGGEFFKKNLDYRANTNKILEKMNLSPGGGGSGVTNVASPVQRKEFLSPFKKTLNNQTSSNTPPSSDEKKPSSMKPFVGIS